MLQTAASLIQDEMPQADALRGQPEFANTNNDGASIKRRSGNRKRKRRPQVVTSEEIATGPTASNPIPYWRIHNEESSNLEYTVSPSPTTTTAYERRSTTQTGVRRRKPSTVREPLAALEKEQKLYELRNTKPEAPRNGSQGSVGNRNSEHLKNILKNNGGLSLSEILQQKNLSLDDLLKGKQNALQALQTTATAPAQNPGREPSSRFSTKPKFKLSSPAKATTADQRSDQESKEHSKLTALQKLKLFGSSSRPTGSQVGLVDHLTTRKKEGPLYTTSTTSSTTTTTTTAPTTRIPLYKKILHQRSTLRPSFLLKNSQVMTNMEPEHVTKANWYNVEPVENKEDMENEEPVEEDMDYEEEYIATSTLETLENTTWRPETTTSTTSTTTTRKPTTAKPTTTKITTTNERPPTLNKDLTTSTRRMYSSTRGFSRATNRFSTTSSTASPPPPPSPTTPPATTTTLPTQTTTTTTSTTTASSSTMNLTPRANLNLNTDDIRERIQETLLKNLIEKEDSFKKASAVSSSVEMDTDDDLENFFEETVKPKTTKSLETSTITTRMKHYTSASPPPSSTQQSPNVIPDFDNVDDRTDLLELIEDRRSGNRLFKVLEQRNMTLDELIEHRKRGSSQLHLATIVQSPSRYYPDKKVVLQDNMDIVTAFENFPHFNLLNLKSVKPDDIKTDSQGSSYFTSIIDIEPTDEIYKNGKVVAATLDEKVSLLPDRSDKSLGFFPSWKTLALASLATSTTKKETVGSHKQSPFYLPQPKMLLDNNSSEDDYEIRENELVLINSDDSEDGGGDESEGNADVDYRPQSPVQAAVRVATSNVDVADNIENRAHDLVDLELSGHGFKRSPAAAGALASNHKTFYANMPAGIKSAIVASATIVLTALVTFMVIFAVCRWKQKHHRMTNIMKSYNAMKSKLPPIATTTTASAAAVAAANPSSCTRHSSLREMNSLLGGSGLSVAATITTTTTGVPNTPSPAASQTTVALGTSTAAPPPGGQPLFRTNSRKPHEHHLQRPSSLLFHRSPPPSNESQQQQQQPTNLSILSNCNLADLKRTGSDLRGSTTSLSFSLTSGHNIPNTHVNSMDANSPEVQEYLFDTLRNSF